VVTSSGIFCGCIFIFCDVFCGHILWYFLWLYFYILCFFCGIFFQFFYFSPRLRFWVIFWYCSVPAVRAGGGCGLGRVGSSQGRGASRSKAAGRPRQAEAGPDQARGASRAQASWQAARPRRTRGGTPAAPRRAGRLAGRSRPTQAEAGADQGPGARGRQRVGVEAVRGGEPRGLRVI